MARLLGLVLTLLVASLAVASPALAFTTVAYQGAVPPPFGHGAILTITGDDTNGPLNDTIGITQNGAAGYVISRTDVGGSLTTTNVSCGAPPRDLAHGARPHLRPGGGWHLDRPQGRKRHADDLGVTTPITVAGGSENDPAGRRRPRRARRAAPGTTR